MFSFMDSTYPEFNKNWDKLHHDSKLDWRYGRGWQEYLRAYSGDRLVADLSFIVHQEDTPVALCPLLLEKVDGIHQLSAGAWYNMAPIAAANISEKNRRNAEIACYNHVDEQAKNSKAVRTMMTLSPLLHPQRHNVLMEYGFLDASYSTSVVMLDKNEEKLWQCLRRRFKPFINKGKRSYKVHIIDATAPDYEMHEAYRRQHRLAAGRWTRSKLSFDLMFKELQKDRAVLIGLEAKGRMVAFSYFLHDQRTAYFGSASDDPEYSGPAPLQHLIMWEAIRYYHKRGFQALEIGWQPFSAQIFEVPTKKELSIAFFKRGFETDTLPCFRGIKYYDRDRLRHDLALCTETLMQGYNYE